MGVSWVNHFGLQLATVLVACSGFKSPSRFCYLNRLNAFRVEVGMSMDVVLKSEVVVFFVPTSVMLVLYCPTVTSLHPVLSSERFVTYSYFPPHIQLN
jgi:hypothetical protein